MLIIISSPSGAGKTSLCKKLLEIDKTIKPSISVTTREPRKNEINGEDYIFVTKNDFNLKIESDEFLEYATVFNNKYGINLLCMFISQKALLYFDCFF